MTDTPISGGLLVLGGFVVSGVLLLGAALSSPFPVGNPFTDTLCNVGVPGTCPEPVAIDLPEVGPPLLVREPLRVVSYGAVSATG